MKNTKKNINIIDSNITPCKAFYLNNAIYYVVERKENTLICYDRLNQGFVKFVLDKSSDFRIYSDLSKEELLNLRIKYLTVKI